MAEKVKPTFSIFLTRFLSPIEGPGMIAMVGGGECVGGWMMKIVPKKSTDVFDFFGAIFGTHQGSCDDCDGGLLWVVGDENCDLKN